MAKNSLLRDLVLAAACDIRQGASGENSRCWFGEILDGIFDMVEKGFANIDDSRKHYELNSILVD
jgi:hypothetical protein